MTCQEAQGQMMDALDGNMSEIKRRPFQEHLQLCRECAQTWLTLQQVDRVLRSAVLATPPDGFASRASRAALKAGRQQRRLVGLLVLGFGGLVVGLLFIASALLSGADVMVVLVSALFGQTPGVAETLVEGLLLLIRMVWVMMDVWRTVLWGPFFWPTVAMVAFGTAGWLVFTYAAVRLSWQAVSVR